MRYLSDAAYGHRHLVPNVPGSVLIRNVGAYLALYAHGVVRNGRGCPAGDRYCSHPGHVPPVTASEALAVELDMALALSIRVQLAATG